MKLIVVDDYPLEGRAIEFMLKKDRPDINYCGHAFSGQSGLDLALKIQPDIAIVDVKMPGMDGLTLTKMLNTQLPLTRVIVVSAFCDFVYAQTALRNGACDYILKPVNPEELFLAIDRVQANKMIAAPSLMEPYPVKNRQVESLHVLIAAIQSGESANSEKLFKEYWNHRPRNVQDSMKSEKTHARWFVSELRHFMEQEDSFVAKPDLEIDDFFFSSIRDKLHKAVDINDIYAILLDSIKAQTNTYNSHLYNSGYERVKQAKAFIEQNLHKKITLQFVAQKIYISPHYLSRIFKKTAGINFMDYVISRRLEKSKHLLLTTNDTVENIAAMVGYEESNSFRRLFKHETGFSPREYRSQKQNM